MLLNAPGHIRDGVMKVMFIGSPMKCAHQVHEGCETPQRKSWYSEGRRLEMHTGVV